MAFKSGSVTGRATKRLSRWVRFGVPVGLCLLVAAVWLGMYQGAQKLVDRLRWFGTPTYSSMSVGLGGDIELLDFHLASPGPNPVDRLRATRVRIETPGTLWLLLRAFVPDGPSVGLARFLGPAAQQVPGGAPQAFPALDELGITLDDVAVGTELAQFGDLRWVGLSSAAALDSVGCEMEQPFNQADLKAMGLTQAPTQAHLRFDAMPSGQGRLLLQVDRENSSSLEYALQFQMDEIENVLDADWSKLAITERSWNVVDQGFISARNRYCASRLGISREGYVERHLGLLKRELMNAGAVPTAELESTYRRYVVRGGTLTWHSRPTLTMSWERLSRFTLPERLRIINATLESVRGRAVPFRFDIVAPPTADVAIAVVPDAVGPPAPTASSPATTDAGAAAAGGTVNPPEPSSTSPAAAVASQPPVASATPALQPQEPVAVPLPPTATVPAPGASNAPNGSIPSIPPADTMPSEPVATAAERAPNPAAPAPGDAPTVPTEASTSLNWSMGSLLQYEDLEKLIGYRIVVRSKLGSVREGTLESYNRVAIVLQLPPREGSLSIVMPRDSIKKVEMGGRNVAFTEPLPQNPSQ